jgi:hypothetical protein
MDEGAHASSGLLLAKRNGEIASLQESAKFQEAVNKEMARIQQWQEAAQETGGAGQLGARNGLRNVARIVHEALGNQFGINQTTVAIAKVRLANGEISYFASGSGGTLRPRQREELARLGVPDAHQFFGAALTRDFERPDNHAERIIIRNLPEDAKILGWGIAWAGFNKSTPCKLCAPHVNDAGGMVQY